MPTWMGREQRTTNLSQFHLRSYPTLLRPDLVILDRRHIWMLEWTVYSNYLSGLANTRAREQEKSKFIQVVVNRMSKGVNVSYNTVEVDALGHH